MLRDMVIYNITGLYNKCNTIHEKRPSGKTRLTDTSNKNVGHWTWSRGSTETSPSSQPISRYLSIRARYVTAP